jgi:23S rRNA (pseudouridine1915-N3)-methyltransferase
MPAWVREACEDYSKRLRARMPVTWLEIPASRRGGGDARRAVQQEGEKILASLRTDDYVVALDEHGKQRSSVELSKWLGKRLSARQNLAFLVGGPDGFAPQVLERADEQWSLSALTLPHALVRVVWVEQIYRAVTLLDGHPYHRE